MIDCKCNIKKCRVGEISFFKKLVLVFIRHFQLIKMCSFFINAAIFFLLSIHQKNPQKIIVRKTGFNIDHIRNDI